MLDDHTGWFGKGNHTFQRSIGIGNIVKRKLLEELRSNGGSTTEQTRLRLAARAFAHSAGYEAAIATWLQGQLNDDEHAFAETFQCQLTRAQVMRYGENPHQQAAFYVEPDSNAGIGATEQLQGKELSFNNVADADAALECVVAFAEPAPNIGFGSQHLGGRGIH